MTFATAFIGDDHYRTQIDLLGPHRIIADEPESLGGSNAGPAPYSLLLASLGACTAITLRMYADAKRWPLRSLQVDLRLSRVNTAMVVDRTLSIDGLDAAQRLRLADIAERTPVTLTLKSGLRIRTTLAPDPSLGT